MLSTRHSTNYSAFNGSKSGRLMLDVEGLELSEKENQLLQHPEVGGLILFTRNYASKNQLAELISSIRECKPDILLAVDHEGGRVQRFRNDFVRIPPMRQLGRVYQDDIAQAKQWSVEMGWLMAIELTRMDIDISFAPVLDLDWAKSEIIGDRAFGDKPEQVIDLASAFMQGMQQAGMAATGKHFPGHGWVAADSHLDLPVDERSLNELLSADIQPFTALIEQGLQGIMPAHILYQNIAADTAGFSEFWLKDMLRGQLGFEGVIFSDDLSMEGAGQVGGYAQRAEAALRAGCDMVLACNNPVGAEEVLSYLDSLAQAGWQPDTVSIQSMRKQSVEFDQERFDKSTKIAHQLLELR